jgi:protein-L-isoaspartate O-methyltransferase
MTCRIENGGLSRAVVFLTDSKIHKKSEPVDSKTVPREFPAMDMSTYTPPERTEFDDMKDTLRDGVKVVSAPQLFPTPPDLAEKIVDMAGIEPHHRVLEPNAGTGNIIKAIGDGPDKVAVEINYDLVTSLMRCGVSGLRIEHDDFLECNGDLGEFDRIVMNPPFKNGEDIKHIKHALSFLKPGGRLVAICANGPRQRKGIVKIAEGAGGNLNWQDLPTGVFKESGTMVNAAIIVINL